MHTSIYPPSDDTFFLMDVLQKELGDGRGKHALDMGTGSGVIAEFLRNMGYVVVGADINPHAVEYCRKKYPDIDFRVSDLFSNIPERFDLIVFNTPYLPGKAKTLEERGWCSENGEIHRRFFAELPTHIKDGGICYVLLSSHTPYSPPKKLKYEIVARKKLFFEEIYVLKIKF